MTINKDNSIKMTTDRAWIWTMYKYKYERGTKFTDHPGLNPVAHITASESSPIASASLSEPSVILVPSNPICSIDHRAQFKIPFNPKIPFLWNQEE